jgi:cyanophycinase
MSFAMGPVLLAGGAEFRGRMAVADRAALALAGGPDAPVCIIPAAAAPDDNHQRAGRNGVDWFRSLGASDVKLLPLIDRASADSPRMGQSLRTARLIYLLGGVPHYLAGSLANTRCWQAVLDARQAGAVVGGSSAGAMVLCEHYYDPHADRIQPGLNLLPGVAVIPHHERVGRHWSRRLQAELPGTLLIGIDEETGVLIDASSGRWQIRGRGILTAYRFGQTRRVGPEAAATFAELFRTP